TSWCAFRVPCESSRSQGRRASRQCGNMHKVRWKDGDFASAVEDLQEQDSQLMEELQRVAGESEELRKKSEPPGKLGSLWSWSRSDVLLQIPTLYCTYLGPAFIGGKDRITVILKCPAAVAACEGRDRSRRFAEELEFVQCLANPSYDVPGLSGLSGDTGFAHFLDYLSGPTQFVHVLLETAAIWSLHADLRCRNITYPASLVMLDLLRDPAVRGRLQRTDAESFLSSNLLHAWGKVKEVRLSPEADLAGIEAVEDPIIDEPAPKSELL
ncbi:unnamed protein product, partial [Symbiodinium sp. KB8]